MKILFIHQNFPGQYKHLAPALGADPDNQVVAIGDHAHMTPACRLPGIRLVTYKVQPPEPPSNAHPYVRGLEAGVLRGQAVFKRCQELKQQGFVPDLICCHPGWGDGLYLKDVYPDARLLNYFEYYYHAQGTDLGFDPEFPANQDDRLRVRTKNAINLFSLADADWGITPTRWQASLLPGDFRSKVSTIFDGVRTHLMRPNPNAYITLNNQLRLTPKDEVITFVSRQLEPYRGFHTFMRALPEILRRRPKARVVIVGKDGVSYGRKPKEGTYRQKYLREVGNRIDLSRVHFVGWISYDHLVNLFQVSSAHIYLTYPFILSWSMLESMSAGCLVIGSRTPPVQELIEDGKNGLLVDFFSPSDIAEAIDRVLDHPDRMRALRENARQTILDHYDLETICLPRQMALLRSLLAGDKPVSAGT
jgi:glycosyltransferase involved in cell wall biosynthesis